LDRFAQKPGYAAVRIVGDDSIEAAREFGISYGDFPRLSPSAATKSDLPSSDDE
jgi:hypothetical protein